MTRIAIICAALALAAPASAHDFWTNGEPVPPGVKALCCGPEDVHRLKPSAVHIMADGFHIDGIKTVVPISRAFLRRTDRYGRSGIRLENRSRPYFFLLSLQRDVTMREICVSRYSRPAWALFSRGRSLTMFATANLRSQ